MSKDVKLSSITTTVLGLVSSSLVPVPVNDANRGAAEFDKLNSDVVHGGLPKPFLFKIKKRARVGDE